MNWILLLYIISVSLQIAGALILIVFAISARRENVIRIFAKSNMILRDGNTKKLLYNHYTFIDTYKTTYYSKISVFFIAVGYIIGVFGENRSDKKFVVAITISAMTIGLIFLSWLCVKLLAKQDIVQRKITSEELEEIGVEPNMESLSNEQIEALFNEKFKK